MKTIGIDTGGTFTDLLESDGQGGERAFKLRSTPEDPGLAVRAGLIELESRGAPGPGRTEIVHGTTVGLNALLTGRVARTALVTDLGFADLIEIGRQDRPDLYALEPSLPAPLVPRERRFEISGRSRLQRSGALSPGSAPTADELARLTAALLQSGAESVAVCLLHSYLEPEVELRVARVLEHSGLSVSCSAELCREPREYERFSTAVVNAAVAPLMERYLGGLAERLEGRRLWLLQQSGGRLAARTAAREPVRVLLSGPAGGAIGARRVAEQLDYRAVLSFDLGGTSTDVAFQNTDLEAARAAVELPRIAGQPIAVPSLDIHTIGCGGGSLARVEGGVLKVGPESAGADPGPVAYGRGEIPTLTDAHALLGQIAAGGFLDGQVELDLDAVERAFERLGRELGSAPIQTAEAVIGAARAAMARALKVMSLERGHDPRQLPLIAFGGGGGLHAGALMEQLGMPRAVVPRWPGALSAWGMTRTQAARSAQRAVFEPLDRVGAKDLACWFESLFEAARQALEQELDPGELRHLVQEQRLELRYQGQTYSLSLPPGARPAEDFERAHERLYGYRLKGVAIELVSLQLNARLPAPPPRAEPPVAWTTAPADARLGEARCFCAGAWRRVATWQRERLPPGAVLEGPCRIEEYTGTTWVPPGQRALTSAGGHLLLERGGGA